MYCIYRITNKINGKTYIGQHKYKKLNDSYMGSGKILKQSIKKYGIENFEKEILYSRIQYKATADDMEKFAIAKERANGKAEYNIADGGQGGYCAIREKNGMYGKHHSEETKRKISEANKGHVSSNKGKHLSKETIKKLSESLKGKIAWNKGKPMSEEQKKKLSEICKGRPSGHKGKLHSEESKKKMSKSWEYDKHFSEETRRKLSEANKGKHWYNNGEINILSKECPDGFTKGRLRVYH